MIKAILIDAENRVIKYVELEPTLEGMYLAGGFGGIETANFLPEGDSLFADSDAYLKTYEYGFLRPEDHYPVSGNGLIVGSDSEGNTTSCKATLEMIDKMLPPTRFWRTSKEECDNA